MPAYIEPTREQFAALQAMPRRSPIQMLNLVRFRFQAAYPHGRTATGQDA